MESNLKKIHNPFYDKTFPLVVDLDGTLIYTDLLHEGVILLLKRNFFYIFLFIPWLLKGKVFFKNKIFALVQINPKLLPYNSELLEFLKKEADNGRTIVLATASPVLNAIEISNIHPLFDQIYGTDNKTNLKGFQKSAFLVKLFGKGKFDYVGNSFS